MKQHWTVHVVQQLRGLGDLAIWLCLRNWGLFWFRSVRERFNNLSFVRSVCQLTAAIPGSI
jgi:hypothetical protein